MGFVTDQVSLSRRGRIGGEQRSDHCLGPKTQVGLRSTSASSSRLWYSQTRRQFVAYFKMLIFIDIESVNVLIF